MEWLERLDSTICIPINIYHNNNLSTPKDGQVAFYSNKHKKLCTIEYINGNLILDKVKIKNILNDTINEIRVIKLEFDSIKREYGLLFRAGMLVQLLNNLDRKYALYIYDFDKPENIKMKTHWIDYLNQSNVAKCKIRNTKYGYKYVGIQNYSVVCHAPYKNYFFKNKNIGGGIWYFSDKVR